MQNLTTDKLAPEPGATNNFQENLTLPPCEVPNELKQAVKERIVIGDPEKVILLGFANRTNTGGAATSLGHTPLDITRHIQPIKAFGRQILQDEGIDPATPLDFDGFETTLVLDEGTHLIKETLGPLSDNPGEWLNSFDLLTESGLAGDRIVFCPTTRDIFDVVASTMRMWNLSIEQVPFDSINRAFVMTMDTAWKVIEAGGIVVPYVHEFIRDHDPEVVIERMCENIGIEFSPDMTAWDDKGEDPYFEGKMKKYDLPPDNWIQGNLAKSKGGRGGLIWKEVPNPLTEEEREIALDRLGPAFEVHNQLTEIASAILGLN